MHLQEGGIAMGCRLSAIGCQLIEKFHPKI